MRIALVGTGVHAIPPRGYGGVERTLAELAVALSGAGVEVEVLNEVRRERSIDEYSFALGLARRLRAGRFDAIHASTPVVGNRLRLAGLPYVYTTHSRHWFQAHGWRARWGLFLERRAVAGAATAIALTDRLRRRIAEELPGHVPDRFPVIPIGVDAGRFRPAWEARTGRRALGVGVVARFKRWHLAARGLAGSGLTLTVVGPTPDAAYATELRSAGVELPGEVGDAELLRYFGESDLLVHPSSVELLAGVVLQGLAAGLPVLGAGPVAELIEPGRTGFATAEGADDAAIAAAFAEWSRLLAGDPRRRRAMGEAGRESARARFSWEQVAREHLEAYRATPAR